MASLRIFPNPSYHNWGYAGIMEDQTKIKWKMILWKLLYIGLYIESFMFHETVRLIAMARSGVVHARNLQNCFVTSGFWLYGCWGSEYQTCFRESKKVFFLMQRLCRNNGREHGNYNLGFGVGACGSTAAGVQYCRISES